MHSRVGKRKWIYFADFRIAMLAELKKGEGTLIKRIEKGMSCYFEIF